MDKGVGPLAGNRGTQAVDKAAAAPGRDTPAGAGGRGTPAGAGRTGVEPAQGTACRDCRGCSRSAWLAWGNPLAGSS